MTKYSQQQLKLGLNSLLLLSLPLLTLSDPKLSLGQSANQDITRVNASFTCGKLANQWTTLVNASSRPNEEVALIIWQSNAFAGVRVPSQNSQSYNNQQRCKIVSDRLNKLFQSNQLEFITSGAVNGATVICGTRSNRETCTPSNIIFTLRERDQAATIIKQFYDLQRGLTAQPILQTNKPVRLPTHIKMREVILNAPGRSKR